MTWYYAVDGQQTGPFTDEQFRELVVAGKIQPGTLVWQQKLPNWIPLAQVPPEIFPPVITVPPSGAAPPPGTTPLPRCSNCGGQFPEDNLVQIENALVCANCKPIVLHRIKEGVNPLSTAANPDELVHRITSENRTIEVGRCFSVGWQLYKNNFGPMLGVTVLLYLIMIIGSAVPFIGSCISLVISGPVMGGLYFYYIKRVRGQPATVSDGFAGFSNNFGQLMLGYLVSAILAALPLMPGVLYFVIRTVSGGGNEPPTDAIVVAVTLGAIGLLAAWFFTIVWWFTLPLIIDKKLTFWPAMNTSWRAVMPRLGPMILLVLASVGILILGLLACVIGIIFVGPLVFAAYMVAYEDLFGDRQSPAPATTPNG